MTTWAGRLLDCACHPTCMPTPKLTASNSQYTFRERERGCTYWEVQLYNPLTNHQAAPRLFQLLSWSVPLLRNLPQLPSLCRLVVTGRRDDLRRVFHAWMVLQHSTSGISGCFERRQRKQQQVVLIMQLCCWAAETVHSSFYKSNPLVTSRLEAVLRDTSS